MALPAFRTAMRPTTLFLVLLLFCAPTQTNATWNRLDNRSVAAIDFYNAHLGLIAFADPTHALMRINDSSFAGIWAAPDVISGIVIQDSNIAWATVNNKGLYHGDKNWTNWVNTSVRTDQTLVGASPSRVFLSSTASPQFSWTIDGSVFTAATGIPVSDAVVAMDYFTNEVLFAVTRTGVYCSFDGGTVWTLGKNGLVGAASVFADRVHHIVYTGGDELRMSTDSGRTWTVVYAPPELTSFHELDGQVFGAHDCTGTLYISNGYSHGTSVLRSQSQAQRFEDCEQFPFGAGTIQKGWAFDRGSLAYWWDINGTCSVSRDGLNGLLTDSVKLALDMSADSVSDTLCSASAQAFAVHITSSFCTAIRIDSISVIHSAGKIATKFTAPILTGSSVSLPLTYTPLVAGLDSSVLRVWFHSLEWGVREHHDIAMIAMVTTLPPFLEVANSVDFGKVHVDSAKTLTLTLTNSGCSPLRVDSVLTSNPALILASSPPLPAVVKRDSGIKIRLTFMPHLVGDIIESIEIGTNAGHRFIEIDGAGVKEVNSVPANPEAEHELLYPNPASSMLFLRNTISPASFDLVDILGRSVLHADQTIGEDHFDVTGLPNGMYTARIGQSRITRVLIQH